MSAKTEAIEGTMMGSPAGPGLYDPRNEHDSCGVGFVVNIKGARSHDIVLKGIEVLNNLTHRGACGCDPRTGDGAGMLLQIPHEFLSRETRKVGFELPARGEYGVGMLFLPLDDEKRKAAEEIVESVVRHEGLAILGWRDIPHVPSACGDIARRGMPAFPFSREAKPPPDPLYESYLRVYQTRPAGGGG